MTMRGLAGCRFYCWFLVVAFVAWLSFEKSASAADEQPPTATEKADKEPAAKEPATEKPTEVSPVESLPWVKGPAAGNLGIVATIKIPPDFRFLEGNSTRELMAMMGNTNNGEEVGTLAPNNLDWFVVFEYSAIGYVKDDEGANLDADAILESYRVGTERSNEERRKHGFPAMEILDWLEKPNYDQATHNVQWCINAASEGHTIANHNTRLLGRDGVMKVTLVAEPQQMPSVLPQFKSLLAGYSFNTGKKYTEFRAGDKVAEYGLTALVAGGGLAVAAKSGLLAKLLGFAVKAWKIVALGAVAVLAALKSLVSKIFGSRAKDTTS